MLKVLYIGFNAILEPEGKGETVVMISSEEKLESSSTERLLGLPGLPRFAWLRTKLPGSLEDEIHFVSPIDLTKSYSISVQNRYIRPLWARVDMQLRDISVLAQYDFDVSCD